MKIYKPTKEEVQAAAGRTVPDVIARDLRVLFCGINPGLYTAAVRHHFARPGNRFWPTLHKAGFTPRRLKPHEDRELLEHGVGVTNIVERVTRAASELTDEELRAGAKALEALVREHRPKVVAIVGVTAYRVAFDRPKATMGPQPDTIGGRPVWVLPNPSGLNAHYGRADLARVFAEFRAAVELA